MGRVVRRGYVDTPGGQVHYRRAPVAAGPGPAVPAAGVPLVVLHQAPGSSSMWEPLLPELARCGIDAIAFDLPGLGLSDAPATPPDIADYARAILAAADGLGLARFAVLGHHTGASVGLALAAEVAPQRVTSLVAYGVALLEPAWAEQLARETAPPWDGDGGDLLERWRELWEWSPGVAATVVPRAIADLLLAGPNRAWAHQAVGRCDHRALLAALQVPALFLAGAREGLRRQTEEAASLAPSARFAEPGDVGGWVADEDPAGLAETVARFLREARGGA